MDILSYILAKKYADKLVVGGGAIKGKNCIIENIEPVVGATRVHFKWTLDDGTVQTDYIDIPDGEKGDKGDTGDVGPIGPKGDTGAQGVQGLQGAKGDKGDKGDVGNTGATGATGAAATIQVGSVVSGVSPSITNAGTSQNAVFNFVLPKGDKGDTGEKGADGADGKSFEIKARFQTEQELIAAYPTGPDNPSDAYFVGTTTSPDLYTWLSDDDEWFNNGPIAGVKGDKGDTGDDGFSPVASVTKAGGIATITIRDKVGVTTATVSDGINGVNGKSAYEIAVDEGFVGTESEWLASLVGAKGETGEQGEQGIQGVQGVKGDQGIQGVKGDAGFSPVANVTENNGVYTIHIEDESGTTEEEIDMSSYASASDVSTINSKIPSTASSSNKMATASDITNITNKIPSNASSSNKLVAASDTAKRKNVSITATSSIENDIKTLLDTLIAESNGVYEGSFTRTGNTSGYYSVSVLSIWNVTGVVSICGATSATYRVAKFKSTEQGAYTYEIKQLLTENEAILRHDISIPVASGTTLNNPFSALQYQLIHTDWTFLTSSDWRTASGGYELQGYHWGAYTATHTAGNNVVVTGTITWDAKPHTFSAYHDPSVPAWKVTINGEELIYNADNIVVTKDTSTGRRVFVRNIGDTNTNALYNALSACDLINRPSTGIFNWTLQQSRICVVGAPYNAEHWTTPLEAGNLYYMQNPRVSTIDSVSADPNWWIYWSDGNVYTACNMWGESNALCTYVALEYII